MLVTAMQVRITRAVAGIIGFASIGIAVAASEFDGILRLGVTAVGLVSGPLLALFVLGLFTTVANKVVRNPSSPPTTNVTKLIKNKHELDRDEEFERLKAS